MPDHPSLSSFADAVAAGTPAPGGGAVAAVAAALAAALPAMVARVALGRASPSNPAPLQQLSEQADTVRARLLTLADQDAAAYQAVIAARRTKDKGALAAAWWEAARVPAEVVKECREVARLARRAAREGPRAALPDAVMAALLAAAAAAGSQLNLRLNVQAAGRPARLKLLVDESELVLQESQQLAVEVRLLAEGMLETGGGEEEVRRQE